jgi:hypothetical protein
MLQLQDRRMTMHAAAAGLEEAFHAAAAQRLEGSIAAAECVRTMRVPVRVGYPPQGPRWLGGH